jgi:hypothetical protein
MKAHCLPIILLSFTLSGCMVTSFEDQKTDRFIAWNHAKMEGYTNTKTPPQVKFYAVNPKNVVLDPKFPGRYRKIGKVYASRYNNWGIKRQTGRIYDVLQDLAGEHGGNAVINIQKEKGDYSGVVIHYV